MEIKNINNKADWDAWFMANSDIPPFPQSWEWGEIFSAEGKKIERLTFLENGQRIFQAQIVYSCLPFGWQYAFCPKLFWQKKNGPLAPLLHELVRHVRAKKCLFLRVETEAARSIENFEIKKIADINPRATLILNLEKTEEELFAGMHSKTRYNIRLAERKKITLREEKNLGIFLKLSAATARRGSFRLHEKGHYAKVLASPAAMQTTAYKGEAPVATAVFFCFGDTFTYLYGAFDYDYRSLMAPYLLQWRAIGLAKKIGFKYYDFFGVAPLLKKPEWPGVEFDRRHQLAGVTRLKLGFGGEYREDSGTWDLIIQPVKYKVYESLRRVRRFFARIV